MVCHAPSPHHGSPLEGKMYTHSLRFSLPFHVQVKAVDDQSSPLPLWLGVGRAVEFIREWNHCSDPNRVSLWLFQQTGRVELGYVPPHISAEIADILEMGRHVRGVITDYRPSGPAQEPFLTVLVTDVKTN